ncbi:MAG: hypothetical protein ACLVI6_01470 [Bifidobacterium bifidum]
MRLADESGWRRPMVLTLGLCGIRWGEMAGLRVGDVDLRRHRLWVRRSATEVSHRIVEDTPKSDEWRQVVFPDVLGGMLRDRCSGRGDNDLLFTDPGRADTSVARMAPTPRRHGSTGRVGAPA